MKVPWRAVGQHSALTGFEVRVEGFDGPLDLLLDLIERQGLDITGVSVLAVTDQFLAYAQDIETRYADIASEFLLVGSQLLLLKSRALLPAQANEPQEETADDLAARLRVYAAFKAVAADLADRWESGASSFIRVATPLVVQPPLESGGGDLDVLIAAMQALTARAEKADVAPPMPRRSVSIGDRIRVVRERLARDGELAFSVIAAECNGRDELVATFMALLHLVIERSVQVVQDQPFGEIMLRFSATASSEDGQAA